MKTTVIIPTTGHEYADRAVCSVLNQYKPAKGKALVVIDGPDARLMCQKMWASIRRLRVSFMDLPENVGANGWYGHRVYASVPMLVNTKYVAFLDEDNWFAPDWIATMEAAAERLDADIVTCRRTITRQDESIIGLDNAESIGHNKLHEPLFDTNTYLIRQSIAHKVCPAIYGQWGADRLLTDAVLKSGLRVAHLRGYHGTFYRSPEKLYTFFESICTPVTRINVTA